MNIEDTFSRFDIAPDHGRQTEDGRTNRQTDGHITAVDIALRTTSCR